MVDRHTTGHMEAFGNVAPAPMDKSTTGGDFPVSVGNWITLGLSSARFVEPSAYRVRHCVQAGIADAFTVDAGHVIANMAHDVIDRNLILAFAAHVLKCVAQRVETDISAMQLELLQQHSHLFGEGTRVTSSPSSSGSRPA